MKLRILTVLTVLAAGAAMLLASGPIGVYAIVEEVKLEPNEANPERIQVWGAFSVIGGGYGAYSTPQRGYLYYRLNTSSSSSTRATLAAWADLKKMAGTGTVIGFGGGFIDPDDSTGKIRKTTEKPQKPDVFPLGNPVVTAGRERAVLGDQLRAALNSK